MDCDLNCDECIFYNECMPLRGGKGELEQKIEDILKISVRVKTNTITKY